MATTTSHRPTEPMATQTSALSSSATAANRARHAAMLRPLWWLGMVSSAVVLTGWGLLVAGKVLVSLLCGCPEDHLTGCVRMAIPLAPLALVYLVNRALLRRTPR